MTFRKLVVTGSALLLISACGEKSASNPPPPPIPSTTTIHLTGTVTTNTSQPVTKVSGGTIPVMGAVSLTGTVVTIPPNSLPADTTLTIGQVSNSTLVPGDVLVTDIGPSGTQFDPALPVSLSIKYNPAYLTNNFITDTSTLKLVAYDDGIAPETHKQTAPLDTTNHLLTANTTHFSQFAVLGYSNASLKGYYRQMDLVYNTGALSASVAPAVGAVLPAPKGFTTVDTILSFDGAGAYSLVSGSWILNGTLTQLAAGSCAGNYTVAPDGTFTVAPTTGSCSGFTGQVLAGGSTYVLSNLGPSNPIIAYGIKRISSTYSASSLSGAYSYSGFGLDSTSIPQSVAPAVGAVLPAVKGFNNGQGTITFNGSGGLSFVGNNIANGVVTPDSASGTYTVDSEGGVKILLDGGGLGYDLTGQIMAGGNTLVMSRQIAGEQPNGGIAIKIQTGTYSVANAKGIYTVSVYGYNHGTTQGLMPAVGAQLPSPKGFYGGLFIFSFDGLGGYSLTGNLNIDSNNFPRSATGTYTVSPTGVITLTENVTLTVTKGQVSRDGSTVVTGSTTSGNNSSLSIGLIR